MPTATSAPEEPKASESRPMSRLEIGLIVGVSAFFITLIFFIFLIRALDQRRRKKVLRRMAEDARNRTPEEEMLRRRLAWLQVERESKYGMIQEKAADEHVDRHHAKPALRMGG
ncbi:hypothetical protein BFJ72_g9428 [Fusarium proliferatum]|uniref:Uncharacterized protein n=1 Tax=Gibberella intermedia TaxID=948311 RepID=A0A420SY83_GIBIN|nr:hypothetical protein BFJ72_g9428 [Fusarium proliferatum]